MASDTIVYHPSIALVALGILATLALGFGGLRGANAAGVPHLVPVVAGPALGGVAVALWRMGRG